jgi:GNAT superfamily N-acetyltransferase
MRITVRRAAPEDAELMWRLQVRAIRELCSSHYSRDEIRAWCALLEVERYEKPIRDDCCVVAEHGAAIVGAGHLDPNQGRVEALYVSPEHAGRGVGRKILHTLEDLAREAGHRWVRLSASLNAVRFYGKAGYTPQQQKYLLPFAMVACIQMTKEL